MDFTTFCDELKEFAEDLTGEKFEVSTLRKLNDEYVALTPVMENGICAVVNLEEAYDAFMHDVPMSDIINEVSRVIRSTYVNGGTLTWMKNYQEVKNRLFIRVSNAERNKKALENMIHKDVEGIAITYHICIEDDSDVLASAPVNTTLFEAWNVDVETLHRDALKSSGHLYPAVAKTMASVLKVDDVDLKNEFEKEFVLTTERNINGASAMFYPDVLHLLTTHAGFEKACIVPLSIHEVLVCPFDGTESARKNALMGMLETCGTDDFLSDMIYTYDRNTDKVSLLSEA